MFNLCKGTLMNLLSVQTVATFTRFIVIAVESMVNTYTSLRSDSYYSLLFWMTGVVVQSQVELFDGEMRFNSFVK